MKRSPIKRGKPLKARTPMRKVSAKRKAYKASDKGKAASRHMSDVASLPCVICSAWPVEVHHCIHDRYGTRKASDFDTIPLCPPCHAELHAGKATWRDRHGADHGFLDAVYKRLGKKRPD